MGYTHYWEFTPKDGAKYIETQYQKALIACQKIARRAKRDGYKLSGYTAHTAIGAYGGLNINGKGDDGHETFTLREHYNQNDGSDWCKTAQKPYDDVVVACLATLKYYLKNNIRVDSDGVKKEWDQGTELASKWLYRKIRNPIGT